MNKNANNVAVRVYKMLFFCVFLFGVNLLDFKIYWCTNVKHHAWRNILEIQAWLTNNSFCEIFLKLQTGMDYSIALTWARMILVVYYLFICLKLVFSLFVIHQSCFKDGCIWASFAFIVSYHRMLWFFVIIQIRFCHWW